jgi:hypothetical protein
MSRVKMLFAYDSHPVHRILLGRGDDANEGEGNKSANRRYREGVRKTGCLRIVRASRREATLRSSA